MNRSGSSCRSGRGQGWSGPDPGASSRYLRISCFRGGSADARVSALVTGPRTASLRPTSWRRRQSQYRPPLRGLEHDATHENARMLTQHRLSHCHYEHLSVCLVRDLNSLLTRAVENEESYRIFDEKSGRAVVVSQRIGARRVVRPTKGGHHAFRAAPVAGPGDSCRGVRESRCRDPVTKHVRENESAGHAPWRCAPRARRREDLHAGVAWVARVRGRARCAFAVALCRRGRTIGALRRLTGDSTVAIHSDTDTQRPSRARRDVHCCQGGPS
jgi:hypothetical protein